MIVKAQSTAYFNILSIEGKGPRKRVTMEFRMGDEPISTRVLYPGDTLETVLKIDVDTDKEKKWDYLEIRKDG